MTDNIVNLFSKKEDNKTFQEMNLDEAIIHFHDTLDKALGEFQTLSVMEKYELMDSMVTINKMVLNLYVDAKKGVK